MPLRPSFPCSSEPGRDARRPQVVQREYETWLLSGFEVVSIAYVETYLRGEGQGWSGGGDHPASPYKCLVLTLLLCALLLLLRQAANAYTVLTCLPPRSVRWPGLRSA